MAAVIQHFSSHAARQAKRAPQTSRRSEPVDVRPALGVEVATFGRIWGTRSRPARRRLKAPAPPRASFAQQWDIDGTFARQKQPQLDSSADGGPQGPLQKAGACLLQAYSWSSHRPREGMNWYQHLIGQVDEIVECGFTDVILPPCSASNEPQGFSPVDFYCTDSAFGSSMDLKELCNKLRQSKLNVGLEVVVGRGFGQSCAQWQQHWNSINEGMEASAVAPASVLPENGPNTASFPSSPLPLGPLVMDHSNPFVESDCKGWLLWLKQEYGFTAWRFDLASNLDPSVFRSYCKDTSPLYAIADVWRAMRYNGAALEYDQDQHREDLANWVKASKGAALAMDYTTKGVLQSAVERCEYWRLIDPSGNPPGLIGLMPAASVTFLDNHFTGSEQQWWPFPDWGIMIGYAYILTHPGLPCVFHDHLHDWKLKDQIRDLVHLRQRNNINMLSEVKILLCKSDIYVARIGSNVNMDDNFRGVVLKIGPSMDMHGACPDSTWRVAASGTNYCAWEKT